MKNKGYALYGASLSYYTGKVRGYLRRKRIPFDDVLASAEEFRNVIIPRVGAAILPVLVTPEDETVQDSTEILDFLEQRFPDPSIYPSTPRQHLASLLLELYADEWLLHTAVYYRWTYDEEWVLGEWGRVAAPGQPKDVQLSVARAQSKFFRVTWLTNFGVSRSTAPEIEASYESLLDDLNVHFESYPFLLGHRASIGDYGLLGPLFAHLYRDPACGKMMRTRAPRVSEWVERMEFALEPYTGDFLPDDVIPDTLVPILRRAMEEQLPNLEATAGRVADWAQGRWELSPEEHAEATPFAAATAAADLRPRPGEPVPRYLGWENTRFGHATAPRRIATYTLWMLQRAVDYYAGLGGAARDEADGLLQEIGGEALARMQIEARVRRKHHRLLLD